MLTGVVGLALHETDQASAEELLVADLNLGDGDLSFR